MNSAATTPAIPPPFRTVDDVLEGLLWLERAFSRASDRRGVFVSAYVITTRTIGAGIVGGAFLQKRVVERYVVTFANAYRQALADHQAERRDRVPGAWLQAFDATGDRGVSAFQHLLLGINAHVNHDLPYAVLGGGLDTTCDRCYRDHQLINDALRFATPMVRQRIVSVYQPRLRWASWLYGKAVDAAVSSMFERARQHSWQLAGELQSARGPADRVQVTSRIADRAVRAGRAIIQGRFVATGGLSAVSCPVVPPRDTGYPLIETGTPGSRTPEVSRLKSR